MKSKVLNIPVEVMSYVFRNEMRKPFGLFLYMKAFSSGKLHKDSPEIKGAMEFLGIKDKRTFNKYFSTLLQKNWIGYHAETGYIFIRSFSFIRNKYNMYHQQTAKFFPEYDFKDLDAFLFGAIVGARVKRHQYYLEMKKRGDGRTAINKRGIARHLLRPSDSSPEYSGLSVHTIGEMLDLSPTRACELKNRAIKGGYMECNHKFRELILLEKSDLKIKSYIGRGDPELAKKVRVVVKKIGKKNFISVMEQLHDEIIPMVPFKSVRLRRKRKKIFRVVPLQVKDEQKFSKKPLRNSFDEVLPPFCIS